MKSIQKIIDSIDDVIEIAQANSVNAIYGVLNNRVFVAGDDVNNGQIGTYSASYKKTRAKKGLQTSFVDLTNTTNLKNSISRTKKTILFKNDYGVKISGYNEKRFKKRIFAPSDNEAQIYFNILNKELNKLFKS